MNSGDSGKLAVTDQMNTCWRTAYSIEYFTFCVYLLLEIKFEKKSCM